MLPSFTTTILSAPKTVLILCAIISTVLFFTSSLNAFCILVSFSTSSEAVASSSNIIGASLSIALTLLIFFVVLHQTIFPHFLLCVYYILVEVFETNSSHCASFCCSYNLLIRCILFTYSYIVNYTRVE